MIIPWIIRHALNYVLMLGGLMVSLVYAEKATGSIYGTVTDPSGALVANANVTATEKNTNSSRSTTTTDRGQYDVRPLRPGKYKLTISVPGFETRTLADIDVGPGAEAPRNVELQIRAVSEAVEAQEETKGIDTTTASIGTYIDGRDIQELPLPGRN